MLPFKSFFHVRAAFETHPCYSGQWFVPLPCWGLFRFVPSIACLLTRSPAQGRLICFQSLMIMVETAVNIGHRYLCDQIFMSLGQISKNGISGPHGKCVFNVKEAATPSPEWPYHSAFSAQVCELGGCILASPWCCLSASRSQSLQWVWNADSRL